MTIDAMLDDVVAREGPFNQLAADRGGATAWGITQATLTGWRGHPVTVADVKALGVDEAKLIYRRRYFDLPGFATLPPALQPFMLDFAVNSGPPLAIGALQEVVGVKADHVLGPKTLAAVLAQPTSSVLTRLVVWRIMMLSRIVRRDPSQLVFLGGWLSRTLGFLPLTATPTTPPAL